MNGSVNLDSKSWNQLYNFTLQCGNQQNPRDFAKEIVNSIDMLCPFERAKVFFMDENGKYKGQYLVNVPEYWISMYTGYYAYTDDQRYNITRDSNREGVSYDAIRFHNWNALPRSEFVDNFIRPQGISFSCGFCLYDLAGSPRIAIALEWETPRDFSEAELLKIQLAAPQLNNLHKKFYFQELSLGNVDSQKLSTFNLTKREMEIANYLCQGVSPENIGKILNISLSTVYRHIANIYKKVDVSSRQEFLVHFMKK